MEKEISWGTNNFLESLKEEDLKAIWLMRNDEEVLKYAESSKPVSWEEYEAVFKYTDYPKLVFRAESQANQTKISIILGYVEFRNDMINDDPGVKEWSFFVAPEHRGKGWSHVMLEMAIDYAKEKGYCKIRGIVKRNNDASQYLHKKLGFKPIKVRHDTITYIFDIVA
jgi:ribosomal protein S18 acetylase RimI-like enzyme